MAKKKLGSPAPDQLAPDLAQKSLQLLKDYQSVVFATVVLVLTVGVLSVWQHERRQREESEAWTSVARTSDPDPDKLKPLLEKFEGTSAHPFLELKYASKLYDRGSREDLELARTVLERLRDEARGNDFLGGLAKDKLLGIQKELDSKVFFPSTAPVHS